MALVLFRSTAQLETRQDFFNLKTGQQVTLRLGLTDKWILKLKNVVTYLRHQFQIDTYKTVWSQKSAMPYWSDFAALEFLSDFEGFILNQN